MMMEFAQTIHYWQTKIPHLSFLSLQQSSSFGPDTNCQSGFQCCSSSLSSVSWTFSGAMRPSVATWLQRLVAPFFPPTYIVSSRVLQGHLHSVYLLKMSDGVELTLKVDSRRTSSLMRHEKYALETEAMVLSLLSSCGTPYVPRLIRFDQQASLAGRVNYLLRYSVRGSSLAEVGASSLTADDRRHIDRQLGAAVKLIAGYTSTHFGPVDEASFGNGKTTWKQSFLLLLDSLLFDAENKLITLPHAEIQHQVARLAHALDDVPKARLVVLDIGKPSHIILDPATKQISGLTNFGIALWGDVLMADVFENPSPSLLQGYGSDPTQGESAHIRLLLYSCYRSIGRIVMQYYRDRNNEAEITARRELTEKLATMGSVTFGT